MTLVNEPLRWEGVQYATGEKQRAITNSSRKNEEAGPKRKRRSAVDMSSGEGIVRCIGTWNVRSIYCCSVTKSCLTLCDPMDCSMPGSSFLHYQSVLKFMSIELVMLSKHLILCCPLLLPSIFSARGSLLVSWFFIYGGQSTGASALISVLPMNGQGWFPLGLIGLISLQSRGLSRVFSNTTISKYQIFGVQPSFRHKSHVCTWLLEKP